jgi:hypothetical protein
MGIGMIYFFSRATDWLLAKRLSYWFNSARRTQAAS